MIGRTQPVKPFELIRWARACARTHRLKAREAHVLLLLATYANDRAEAWPSIATLARDCGLKVKATPEGPRNTAISAALAALEDAGLIWRRQGGNGKPAVSELLFDPNQGSARAERCEDVRTLTSVPLSRTQGSARAEPNGQRNGQNNSLNYNGNQRPETAFRHSGTLAERSNRGDRTRQPRPLAATLHHLTDQPDEPA